LEVSTLAALHSKKKNSQRHIYIYIYYTPHVTGTFFTAYTHTHTHTRRDACPRWDTWSIHVSQKTRTCARAVEFSLRHFQYNLALW